MIKPVLSRLQLSPAHPAPEIEGELAANNSRRFKLPRNVRARRSRQTLDKCLSGGAKRHEHSPSGPPCRQKGDQKQDQEEPRRAESPLLPFASTAARCHLPEKTP